MSVGPSISGQPQVSVNSPVPLETISTEAIRSQLEKILASPGFTHSDRMVRFLRFTAEEALNGHASALKETILGMEVFDRPSSFDPRTDTIVGSRRGGCVLNSKSITRLTASAMPS